MATGEEGELVFRLVALDGDPRLLFHLGEDPLVFEPVPHRVG